MHDKPIHADQLHSHIEQQFSSLFRPLSESEQVRADYRRYVRDLPPHQPALSMAEWKVKRTLRGNREGHNHD